MTDTGIWMSILTERLLDRFCERVAFIGLQGSRSRGEARPDSDIDAVVLFDRLDRDTIDGYRTILDGMPYRELACGFVSGYREIAPWAPHDLFQFRRDTVAVFGDLDAVLPPEGPSDAAWAANSGACSVYHACAHNMVHERSTDILAQLSKPCRFTLQAVICARTGTYHRSSDALRAVAGPDGWVLDIRDLADAGQVWSLDSDELSERVLSWASDVITEFDPRLN